MRTASTQCVLGDTRKETVDVAREAPVFLSLSLSRCLQGLSDPFVIVELCPHHLFPLAKSQRTQVKLKTLHPVFDELFYLCVAISLILPRLVGEDHCESS